MVAITPAGELAAGETVTVELEFDEQVHAAVEQPRIVVLGQEAAVPVEVSGTRVRFQLTVPDVEMLRVRSAEWREA